MINKDKKNKSQVDIEFKRQYLDKNIFIGLTNLNDGFDSESIKYFSAQDFIIVLDRIQKLGLGIYGIEPWLNGEFYDVKGYEDYSSDPTNPKWYRNAFDEFIKLGKELQYAASYYIPEELIENE